MNMKSKPIIIKLVLVLIVLFLILFGLINFATIRTAEVPISSDDSKSNGTFISDYKLLDSVIKINDEEYRINGIWSAYGIASFSNIFIRTDIEIFQPEFLINLEYGNQFILKYRGHKLFFPDFSNESSNLGGNGIEGDFILNYQLQYSDTLKLKSLDTVKFYLIDPQGIKINEFTLIKK